MGKSKELCIVLCCLGFVGLGGLHDFYLNKIGWGIAKLLTCNFLFIGTIYDLLKLTAGQYDMGTTNTQYYSNPAQTYYNNQYSYTPPQQPYNNYTNYYPETNSGYDSTEIDDTDDRDADFKYLNTERIIGEKIDRAVTKGIITKDEADKLTKTLEKEMKKKTKQFWCMNKKEKTYELCANIIASADNEIKEVFKRIEKA